MASTQSLYMESRDFTQTAMGAPFLLPYLPNSMVITNDGSTIYMGSSTALMVLNAVNTLSLTQHRYHLAGSRARRVTGRQQIVISDPVKQITTMSQLSGSVVTTYGGVGTHAEFSPDNQTVYITAGNQLLVYSTYTGWTNITPATTAGTPVTDVAITVPGVGAYFAGPATTARGYCPSAPQPPSAALPLRPTSSIRPPTPLAPLLLPPTASPPPTTACTSWAPLLARRELRVPTFSDLHVEIPAGTLSAHRSALPAPRAPRPPLQAA